MEGRLDIRAAQRRHAEELAPRMREADRLECLASTGHDPLGALLLSLDLSRVACVALFDGEVGALFGVADGVQPQTGIVWMLTSDVVDEHWREFARRTRCELDVLNTQWQHLYNFVDARHTKALRWARWAGFGIGPPVAFGVAGLPFHPIWRTRCADQ